MGHLSKEVAHALEELGKLFLEEKRYQDGFHAIKESFDIRVKVKAEHREIERSSALLVFL